MKQAVMIGAGNIGRGFIGLTLFRSGYRVTFADVNRRLIDTLHEKREYAVFIRDAKTASCFVTDVDAVDSRGAELTERIIAADLVTTAVGVQTLPAVAGAIADGITERMRHGVQKYLNIMACENAVRATSLLKQEVYSHLDDANRAYADVWIGFPDCVVDRIIPQTASESILDVSVEEFSEWCVEKRNWKGDLPRIEGMTLVDELSAYIERKLFTLNTGHAVCAYLGCLRGYKTILESIQDPKIERVVLRAMEQSGAGLVRKYEMDPLSHRQYVERVFHRFHNPYLRDEVTRVGREPIRKLAKNDRLVSPLLTAYSYHLPVDELLFGTAAALHYSNAQDRQSVELQNTIRTQGEKVALERYAALPASHPLTERILDISRALYL